LRFYSEAKEAQITPERAMVALFVCAAKRKIAAPDGR
tara:strand:+ start:116 stop:226 length:111 start_codon:yes stop_codon:yes gene_type:complete